VNRHNKTSGEALKPDWARALVKRHRVPQRLLCRLEQHKPWVWRQAHRLAGAFKLDAVEDIAQEGFMGIVQADQRFEGNRGSFLNYAKFWIRHHQLRWIRNHYQNVRVPDGKFSQVTFSYVRLDQPVGEDGNDTLMDILPAPNGCPRHEAEDNDAVRVLRECLGELSYSQFEAIRLTYLEGKTFAESGEIMGMSHQGVQSHVKNAFAKLRNKQVLREAVGL
jgi:RNA polymerase sigma factor (sigma-70 family)